MTMQSKHIYTLDIDQFKENFNIEKFKAPFVKFEGVKFPLETGKIEVYTRILQLDKYLKNHKNPQGMVTLVVEKEKTFAEDITEGLKEAIEYTKDKKKKSKKEELEEKLDLIPEDYEMSDEEKEWSEVVDDVIEE